MWTISELTELMNLSRRDIQRLCYSDGHNGGLGLLDPEDSTQGRRHFSDDDVKVLFVVSQYKGLGMTLPEAAELVRKAREDGADTKALVSDLVSELERERDAIERRLAFAKAIEGSILGCGWDALVFAASAVPFLEGSKSALVESLTEFCRAGGMNKEELSDLVADLDRGLSQLCSGGLFEARRNLPKALRAAASHRIVDLSGTDRSNRRAVRRAIWSLLDFYAEWMIAGVDGEGLGSGQDPDEEMVARFLIADSARRLLQRKDIRLLIDLEGGAGCGLSCFDAVKEYGMSCIEAWETANSRDGGAKS